VTGQRDPRIELDRAVERRQVVAERIGPARRPEPDRRTDAIEEMVGGDEHTVAQEAQLAVGMAWRRNELPPVHVLAGLDEARIALVADERPVDGALADELGGHVVRSSVEPEPVEEPFGPRRIPPHELALRVVERTLDDRGLRQLVEVGGRAHVVRVEVRDEDRRDGPAGLRQLERPRRLRVRKPDARVDERPAFVARQEVGVDVPRPRRERQRDTADPIAQLVHRATLAGSGRVLRACH
jgi:hypothetical protein